MKKRGRQNGGERKISFGDKIIKMEGEEETEGRKKRLTIK